MDESPHSTSSHTSGMDLSPERQPETDRDTASMDSEEPLTPPDSVRTRVRGRPVRRNRGRARGAGRREAEAGSGRRGRGRVGRGRVGRRGRRGSSVQGRGRGQTERRRHSSSTDSPTSSTGKHCKAGKNYCSNKFYNTGWSPVATRVDVQSFTEPIGPTVALPDNPLDTFLLLFTPTIIEHIVRETNRYAQQCLANTDKEWATNATEMKAYLGFCILMGIVHEPEIRDYWSQSDLLHYSPIASRISRRRFEEISRYFHLVDNTSLPERGQPGFNRLQKVKDVLDMVRREFSAVYRPHSNLSVDEAMIPFKGEICEYTHLQSEYMSCICIAKYSTYILLTSHIFRSIQHEAIHPKEACS